MTTHHGDPMNNPEATWTKVPAYAAKNKQLLAQTSKENEKNHQIEAQEDENEANGTRTNAPMRIESNYVTRINFKVIPDKNTKTLSALHSICRILAATKEIDPRTCIVSKDKNGIETYFTGNGNDNIPSHPDDIKDFINVFVEEPRMTSRNELVGLITMRSDINFRAIKKSPAV